ncbi:MAG: hypothetical protein ACREIC_21995 [Limisphaerales bacterium]
MRHVAKILPLAIVVCGCASGPTWKRQSFAFALPEDPPTTNVCDRLVALRRVSISPVFQSRSFTYRTGENSYEQDPYAGFLIPPERALEESIRASMRASAVFGRVVEPGSRITPSLIVEVAIKELYGYFRNPSRPVATMALHFMCYETRDGAPQRVILDTFCSHETLLAAKTPAALMAAWDADLREIMNQIRFGD